MSPGIASEVEDEPKQRSENCINSSDDNGYDLGVLHPLETKHAAFIYKAYLRGYPLYLGQAKNSSTKGTTIEQRYVKPAPFPVSEEQLRKATFHKHITNSVANCNIDTAELHDLITDNVYSAIRYFERFRTDTLEEEDIQLRKHPGQFGWYLPTVQDLEKLSKFDINVSEPDHDMPKFQLGAPTKYIQSNEAKFTITKRGGFTKREDELLIKNWKRFKKEYKFYDSRPLLDRRTYYIEGTVQKFNYRLVHYVTNVQQLQFLRYIGKGLKDRRLNQIHRHAQYVLCDSLTDMVSGHHDPAYNFLINEAYRERYHTTYHMQEFLLNHRQHLLYKKIITQHYHFRMCPINYGPWYRSETVRLIAGVLRSYKKGNDFLRASVNTYRTKINWLKVFRYVQTRFPADLSRQYQTIIKQAIAFKHCALEKNKLYHNADYLQDEKENDPSRHLDIHPDLRGEEPREQCEGGDKAEEGKSEQQDESEDNELANVIPDLSRYTNHYQPITKEGFGEYKNRNTHEWTMQHQILLLQKVVSSPADLLCRVEFYKIVRLPLFAGCFCDSFLRNVARRAIENNVPDTQRRYFDTTKDYLRNKVLPKLLKTENKDVLMNKKLKNSADKYKNIIPDYLNRYIERMFKYTPLYDQLPQSKNDQPSDDLPQSSGDEAIEEDPGANAVDISSGDSDRDSDDLFGPVWRRGRHIGCNDDSSSGGFTESDDSNTSIHQAFDLVADDEDKDEANNSAKKNTKKKTPITKRRKTVYEETGSSDEESFNAPIRRKKSLKKASKAAKNIDHSPSMGNNSSDSSWVDITSRVKSQILKHSSENTEESILPEVTAAAAEILVDIPTEVFVDNPGTDEECPVHCDQSDTIITNKKSVTTTKVISGNCKLSATQKKKRKNRKKKLVADTQSMSDNKEKPATQKKKTRKNKNPVKATENSQPATQKKYVNPNRGISATQKKKKKKKKKRVKKKIANAGQDLSAMETENSKKLFTETAVESSAGIILAETTTENIRVNESSFIDNLQKSSTTGTQKMLAKCREKSVKQIKQKSSLQVINSTNVSKGSIEGLPVIKVQKMCVNGTKKLYTKSQNVVSLEDISEDEITFLEEVSSTVNKKKSTNTRKVSSEPKSQVTKDDLQILLDDRSFVKPKRISNAKNTEKSSNSLQKSPWKELPCKIVEKSLNESSRTSSFSMNKENISSKETVKSISVCNKSIHDMSADEFAASLERLFSSNVLNDTSVASKATNRLQDDHSFSFQLDHSNLPSAVLSEENSHNPVNSTHQSKKKSKKKRKRSLSMNGLNISNASDIAAPSLKVHKKKKSLVISCI